MHICIAMCLYSRYNGNMNKTRFEWDNKKDGSNKKKHGVAFSQAQYAFANPKRVIAEDIGHSYIVKKGIIVLEKLTTAF